MSSTKVYMIEVRQTVHFRTWFDGLRDMRARAKVDARIRRVSMGNFGDAKFFDGIGELRIDFGPGYRVYFVKKGNALVILLAGGDKKSQKRDIRDAIEMAKEI
ncbi:putative addiction module killer protein [Sphingobium wenxiniae]|uniref:Putative addiction module killer protein n=1 Tax=Sphingobium wenxiniae (strain DSM 21828 / CGMCC 1.7748 / JZ-1) TaxID=595605 RepID=A0A562KKX8_SPHWJ|nr:type II toxin-antitoxin system RelE/ParE family toxin [Sphingobium wenxiniae]MBB6191178.1 putative addiction module killer protein [Sphingobium wenxiniae]TWH96022.1 putative addiction module killer protein [Sphingobium wenxiniae]